MEKNVEKEVVERELVKLYEKENKELENELIDLLKETEEKTFELREKITENKRFINVMKLRWDDKDIETEI